MSFNARAAPAPGEEEERRRESVEEGRRTSASHVAVRGGRRHKHIRFAPLCAVAVDVEAARQASGSGRMNDLCVLD